MTREPMTTETAFNAGLVVAPPPEDGQIRMAIKLRGDGVQAPGTVVLVQYWDTYTVWFHNRQDGGYHAGDYCDNYQQGVEAFCKRVLRYGAHLAEV